MFFFCWLVKFAIFYFLEYLAFTSIAKVSTTNQSVTVNIEKWAVNFMSEKVKKNMLKCVEKEAMKEVQFTQKPRNEWVFSIYFFRQPRVSIHWTLHIFHVHRQRWVRVSLANLTFGFIRWNDDGIWVWINNANFDFCARFWKFANIHSNIYELPGAASPVCGFCCRWDLDLKQTCELSDLIYWYKFDSNSLFLTIRGHFLARLAIEKKNEKLIPNKTY